MSDPFLLALQLLFMVHTVDGRTVHVNPEQIVSLTVPAGRLVSERVGCIVAFSDGKFLSVKEPCNEVLERMGEGHEPR
jgi:uncharacterized protein YlzI (FlbEa/FlbD family)